MAVSVQDVATTTQRPITDPDEVAAVEMWIRAAVMLIRLRFRERTGDLDQEAVEFVVREAVAAKLKAPDAASRVQVAVDDGSVTKDYTRSAGQVTILDEWWALLEGSLPGVTGAAFSIQTAPTRPPVRGDRGVWW